MPQAVRLDVVLLEREVWAISALCAWRWHSQSQTCLKLFHDVLFFPQVSTRNADAIYAWSQM
jgi:hypothetical protein